MCRLENFQRDSLDVGSPLEKKLHIVSWFKVLRQVCVCVCGGSGGVGGNRMFRSKGILEEESSYIEKYVVDERYWCLQVKVMV